MNIKLYYKKKHIFIDINNTLTKKDISEFELLVIPILIELKYRDVTINLNINRIDKYGINSIIKICNLETKFNGNVVLNKINNNIRKYLNDSDIYNYCLHNERENVYEL